MKDLFKKKKPHPKVRTMRLNPDKLEEVKWRLYEEKAKPNKIPSEVFEAMFREAMEELYWKYGLDSDAVKKMSPEEIQEIAENSLEHAMREKINFRVRRKAVMGGNSSPVSLNKMPESYAYQKDKIAEEAIRERITKLLKEGKKVNSEKIDRSMINTFDKEFRRAIGELSLVEEKPIKEIVKDPVLFEKAKQMALKKIGLGR